MEGLSNLPTFSDRWSGSKLVVIGDTGTTDGLNAVVGDADLLVIEATFLQQDAAIAHSYGHLTAAQAASLAATSNVKRLILTHISGRYPAEAILAENYHNCSDIPQVSGNPNESLAKA